MDRRHAPLIGALVSIVLLAFSNSFKGEFFFDDSTAILGNPYITHIWPLSDAFSAPPRTTNSGRPIACFSLALNYQFAGYQVAGYRAFNVLVHLGCSLLLFGLSRRALTALTTGRLKSAAIGIAVSIAALWALHPLNTVLVNYISQRCELLSNFFILLTLYCSARAFESPRRLPWFIAASLACALGVGSKEVAVVAPLLVLLFERAFYRNSYASVVRTSWPLYIGLSISWILGAALIAQGATADGAGYSKWGPWIYLVSQTESILLYLKLIAWPFVLCFDYGLPPAPGFSAAWTSFSIVVLLGAATVWAVLFRPALGFCLASFFLLLAPSSSVVPLPDIAVEYRVCLAMAGILAAAVVGAHEGLLKANLSRTAPALLCILCAIFAFTTYMRNKDYHSSLSIWSDAARKQPRNARSHANAGVAIAQQGDLVSAEKALRQALALDPDLAAGHMNFAAFLAMQGKVREALPHFVRACELSPSNYLAAFNLGNAFSDLKQSDSALVAYRKAIELNPAFHDAWLNLGIELFSRKEFPSALQALSQANTLNPQHSNAHLMRGRTLLALNQVDTARQAFQTALACDAKNTEAARELRRLQP